MKNNNHMIGRRKFIGLSATAAASAMLFGATGCTGSSASKEADGNEDSIASYSAGTYTAIGLGKKSDIVVEVTFSDSAIESISILEHDETERIARPAFDQLPTQITDYQSLGVDTITGATLTSFGLLTAIEDCVEQAGGDVKSLKTVPAKEKVEQTVEIESDLVVIGAGISGMTAALAAAQKGAKVTVFEKSSSMGGNALVSGGFVENTNAPENLRVEKNDGHEKIFQEILQFNRDAGLDSALVDEVQQQWDEYYSEGNTKLFSSPEFLALQLCMLEGNTYDFQHRYASGVAGGVEWLTGMDFPWMPLVAIPGYSWDHFSGSSEDVNGEGYFNVFEKEMAGLDLEILFATPADELIIENDVIVGAIGTCADGTTYKAYASDAVIIASGGYADNIDMLIEHDKMWGWKDLSTFHSDNNYGHDGDGIRMAMDAGAAFGELPFNQMIFPFVDTVLFATETTVGQTNESLYVNQEGKRFCDEAGSRTDMTIALMAQKDGKAFQVVDQDSSMITNGKTHTNMDVEYAINRGILYRADTLEELAKMMGVNESAFLKTVEDYNTMAETYDDPEFGRSSFGPNALLNTPPFYASPRTWAMHITMDGVATDNMHQAIDVNGEPVSGLYVVGEAASGGRGVGSLGAGYAVAEALYGKMSA